MTLTRIKVPDSREEWLELRKAGIGGSDSAASLGLSRWSSPLAVYCDKVGISPPRDDNEAMRQGRDLEDYVAQRFSEASGLKVRKDNHILKNDDYPWLLANIDRQVVGEKAGLECKTTSVYNRSDFEGGEIPQEYYVQCQHYMAVTGYEHWYLAVLVLNKGFYWFRLERNESDIAILLDVTKELWYEHVEKRIPPLAGEADTELLKELYPIGDIEEYAILDDLNRVMDELWELKQELKETEGKVKEKENIIKQRMGDAVIGETSSYKVTWNNRTSNRFDTTRFKKEHKDVFDEYTTESTSRYFILQSKKE